MNNMFTDGVKRVMQLAREESARLGHNYIGTEHLLLGIIKEGKGKAVTVLTNLGLSLETIKQSVEDYVATSGGTMTIGEVPFTPRAKQILEVAANEAKEMKTQFVDVEHLLLALLKDKEGVAAQILAAFGVDYKTAMEETLAVLEGKTIPEISDQLALNIRTVYAKAPKAGAIISDYPNADFNLNSGRILACSPNIEKELNSELSKVKPLKKHFYT